MSAMASLSTSILCPPATLSSLSTHHSYLTYPLLSTPFSNRMCPGISVSCLPNKETRLGFINRNTIKKPYSHKFDSILVAASSLSSSSPPPSPYQSEEKESEKVIGKEEIALNVAILKEAAKTRKVEKSQVFKSMRFLEKAKLDPSSFLETIGGDASPGRTWMLVFTSSSKDVKNDMKGKDGSGTYFPITAIQRFDASAKEIENGVFLGKFGNLTFKGPFGWNKRRLSFTFNTLKLQIASLNPFSFNIGKDEGRVPGVGKEGKNDPFFIWIYADDEIIVAKGRGGGIAYWCRCVNVKSKFG